MPIDLADLQGLVVRGNNFPRSWHLFYSFPGESAAKEFLRWVRPQIANAVQFDHAHPPDSLTFLGLTYRGLRAAGLESLLRKIRPDFTLGDQSATSNPFPAEFVDGPEQSSLGDTYPQDAPTTWWNGKFETSRIHGSLHVYCQSESIAEQRLDEFRAKIQSLGVEELNPNGAAHAPLAGHALAEHRVHFGYVDAIAQPSVDWENDSPVDDQVDRRHFLLGYAGSIPSAPTFQRTNDFFRNSTYLAFRWMSQDVPAFEQFLTDRAPLLNEAYPTAANLRELLAAKLVGRWRNGVSLREAPINEVPTSAPGNSFMYDEHDPDGLQCPFSAHVRAANPRDQPLNPIVTDVPRLIRRGMVYGAEWEPGVNDNEDRGLFGMFLCASLERQFQMIMRWMNAHDFSPKFRGVIPTSQDPLFGARGLVAERPPFRIPVAQGVLEIPLPQKPFVRSRGTAYLLMPSFTTLDRISQSAN